MKVDGAHLNPPDLARDRRRPPEGSQPGPNLHRRRVPDAHHTSRPALHVSPRHQVRPDLAENRPACSHKSTAPSHHRLNGGRCRPSTPAVRAAPLPSHRGSQIWAAAHTRGGKGASAAPSTTDAAASRRTAEPHRRTPPPLAEPRRRTAPGGRSRRRRGAPPNPAGSRRHSTGGAARRSPAAAIGHAGFARLLHPVAVRGEKEKGRRR